MPAAKAHKRNKRFPSQFTKLVQEMPPQAILDDAGYAATLQRIDQLMAAGKLTKGQSVYLETLVQLVQAYEAKYHAIDIVGIDGLSTLRHLLSENGLSAADLGRLLGVHPSMGSKILNGERSLTIEHVKKLAARFRVSLAVFIDVAGSEGAEARTNLKASRKSLRARGRNIPFQRIKAELGP